MSSSNTPKFIDARRRGFLQGAAVVTGAAATGTVSALPCEPAVTPEPSCRRATEPAMPVTDSPTRCASTTRVRASSRGFPPTGDTV